MVIGIFVCFGIESIFKSFILIVNGVLMCNEIVMELIGDDVIVYVVGVCVGDGCDFYYDDIIFIIYDVENCESC